MQSVRIQPVSEKLLLIDVVCDCGRNGLADKTTGDSNFKHPIVLGSNEVKILVCVNCKNEYTVLAQNNHLHITNRRPPVDEKILFYEGKNYFFSNFSSFKVRWRDIDWMTSEHAYQAAKFDDPDIVDQIRKATSAHDAKKIAHAHKDKVIDNWDANKVDIMEEILWAKLTQHPYIQKKLRESGGREIVENSPTDSFWGRGADWKGQNQLGKLWMKLRAKM